jgi:pentafunctional AROM polypeptide
VYCLSLTYPNITQALPDLTEILSGVDVIEFRADLLEDHSINFVQSQIELLKQHTKLPILFTVRTEREGGKFPNQEADMFALLHLALRCGCEFVDVEIGWGKKYERALIKAKGETKIIASFHNFKETYSKHGIRHVARRCLYTKADIVKLATMAQSEADNLKMFEIMQFVIKKYKTPIIGMCMGEAGKMSRIFGQQYGSMMTMVTHPLLPGAAAPGQMTIQSILEVHNIMNSKSK